MDINLRSQDRGAAAKQTGESALGAVRIDPTASAALEEAIKSAKGAKLGLKPSSSCEMTKDGRPAAGGWTSPTKFLGQAALALLLVGAGWSASYMGTLANREAIQKLEAQTARSQEILARLGTDLEALRETVVAFKEVEHTSSTASTSEQTKLTEKVERLAISLQEPGKKLSALEGRLERMESQILTTLAGLNAKPAASSAPAAPAPATPAPTEAAVRAEPPAAKPAKSEPVDGWVLREVYNGAALVENRSRRLYEVMPGGILPGVGRIEAIERRGTRWVVLTDKGFIGTHR